ncbi:hypothetical protein CerSpe_170420 [Prunus speciosa]
MFWGLSLAWDAGIRVVEIECDSIVAVDLNNNPTGANHPLSNVINCCKLKIHGDWNCVVHHIYREMNTAADALAAMCADLAPGIQIFDLPPTSLIETLAADAIGTSRPRLLPL